MYQCPLCHNLLAKKERGLICQNNHQFDFAKEGYVNLMPVQHKRSKVPGDNKEMMQARRRFLEQGHYDQMRSKVAEKLVMHTHQESISILDIGCGEGYYTHEFSRRLQEKKTTSATYGLDISKVAIRYASKRYHDCHFCVASSHRLPFPDNSLQAIIRIYAPCKTEELNRCLAPDGIIITVTPAGKHLFQLKKLIYPNVLLHDETPEIIEGFSLIQNEKLHYTMSLDGNSAFDLLQMTPFAWRASEEIKSSIKNQTSFLCEADFSIRVYKKSE
ncbi:23S rRNA (guanine(745)-N(1))-methyltransferase [Vibrio salinus]|uniref:23S rRNA (guanine(745)-N(1))-methyltransferase n=1 Tax=Vibrio salinus TaxID=2899784 RepID=UPI001E5B98C7|nr:23S rRNA (guanine(745)-N(1))-methyltransferase [Vibrio salinus]MCE0492923.1 23S rRNA (guanine(745)-N(1))-methyltransferase [Vibrio salinus]